jgi:hypothetical protein
MGFSDLDVQPTHACTFYASRAHATRCLAETLQPRRLMRSASANAAFDFWLVVQERECGEHLLGFLEADVDLAAAAAVPAERRPREPIRCLVAEEKTQLERLVQPNVLELDSC